MIWSTFLIGLVGNFHCIGMCGPIALSLPIKNIQLPSIIPILIYNIGRILSYMVLGVFFGIFGKTIAFAGLQQYFSIGLGLLILLSAFSITLFQKSSVFNSRLFFWVSSLQNKLQQQFSSNSIQAVFTIGILNGFLPCGLVYLAIASAISAGSIQDAAFSMAAFGLGTLPFMVLMPYFGKFISMNFRRQIKKMTPIFVGIFGLILIFRGANIGIPYFSPKANENKTEFLQDCHDTGSLSEDSYTPKLDCSSNNK